MEHIRQLADVIGPRGSTTSAEREAARYVHSVFEKLGLASHFEPFRAPVSGWRNFAVAALIGLLSLALNLWAGTLGSALAAALMAVATGSIFAEMYFRPNPLRLAVRKGESQNVWARIPAADEPRQRLLLVAHLDTHRTPWLFTSAGRLQLLRLTTTLGVIGFVLGTLLFGLTALGAEALRPWSALLLIAYLPVLLATVQPDTTPHSHGANDNASGVGIVLSIAEELSQQPLRQTEVWALASGSEEVGSYGVQAFVAKHRSELTTLRAISIDNVGGEGVGVCLTSVEGMVFPLRPDPQLFGAALEVGRANRDLNVYQRPYTTLHTDATALMTHKVPTLSLVGLRQADGVLPNWHTVHDRLERVDAGAIASNERFVLKLLEHLDRTGMTAAHVPK